MFTDPKDRNKKEQLRIKTEITEKRLLIFIALLVLSVVIIVQAKLF